MAEAVDRVLGWAREKRPMPVRLVNAYSIALGNERGDYGAILRGEGVNFPDGKPVAAAAGWLSGHRARQIRGPELFERVLDAGQTERVRHYLYGTTPETLQKLQETLKQRFPDLVIAGAGAPDFAPVPELASDEVAERIRSTRPDLVWVGLGTPKQDFVAVELARKIGVPALGVGAAFDFSAGTVPAAPSFLRHVGLEWSYRLAKEPRRLWRRYLIGNSQFIALVVRDLLAARRIR
ncbi:WecB/TagA/CpsF family glycosyltransferase [Luteococcus sp.]|uniref:WecB/TagA/CpsF family glycosyltransferase n=1 Tax=Luteococcus sp. TaxID=1969402 RepID=UPI003735A6BE